MSWCLTWRHRKAEPWFWNDSMTPVARWHCQQLSRLLSGAAGDPGVPGLATGSGERKQKSELTGQTHSVPLVRSRQGSLRLGLLQQLGHQNPLEPKVRELVDAVDCAAKRSRSRSPLGPQSEQLCGHRGPARGRPPVQVLRGRPLDAGSQRGEQKLARPRLETRQIFDDDVLVCQAVATSKTGVVNNTIQVKRTDFEVFDALRIDSEDTDDFSGCVEFKATRKSVLMLIALASHC